MGDLIIEKTISGDTVTFQSRIAAPIKSLKVDIMPIQSGSGDPSPTNIRPLTGNDHVAICVCPKNMVTDGDEINMDTRGIHLQVQANRQRVVINGTATRAVNGTSFTLAKNLNPSVLHYLYNVPVTGDNIWSFRGTQNRYTNINGIGYSPTDGYIGLGFWLSTGDTINVDFSPIVSDTPPIRVTFPDEIGTVYGGTLDVISGELIVDTIKIAVDGTANWTMLSPGIYSLLGSIDNACVNTKLSKYRSSMYQFRGTGETKSSGLDKDGYFYIQSSVDRIWVYDSNYSTLADFKAFLNENPLELTYPTTATTTYQLPATEVKTLLTTNIITSDAGAVTVTYDDKDYTDLIAARRRILMETPHSNYLSGPAVAFNTNMAAKLKNLTVNIEPVQAGSGDPSPDNVRTISGWTGANIWRNGKNIIDLSAQIVPPDNTTGGVEQKRRFTPGTWTRGVAHNNHYSSTNGNITIYSNYIIVNSKSGYGAGFATALPQGETFYINAEMSLPKYRIYAVMYANDGTYMGFKLCMSDSVHNAYTVPDGCAITVFEFLTTASEEGGVDCTITNIQLEYGSTATDYKPYVGAITPITFPTEAGTVYGGTLDVTTGVLTVDRAMVDLGDINWNIPESQNGYAQSAAVSNMRGTESAATVANIVCNKYKPDTQNHVYQRTTDKTIAITATSTNNNIRLYDTDLAGMDAAQYKAAVAGTVLVYHIISPVTYQLTPTQVKTLLGNNTIYADTGDVELTYWKH